MQVDRSEGMINLDEVLTFTEAADKWGLADGKPSQGSGARAV